MTQAKARAEFDTSDVDRWVEAMQCPRPLHCEDEVAAARALGRIVAPQSFTISCDPPPSPATVHHLPRRGAQGGTDRDRPSSETSPAPT